MKNKKSIYILLPLVLLIWGAVVYQFFSLSNDTIPEIQTQEGVPKPFRIQSKDTFSIHISKRDPFLGKMMSNETRSVSTAPKTTTKIPNTKEELVWPSILYKGIVSDSKDKVKVYMVIMDGKTYLMKKGEEENGIKLKDGDRETIYVVYKKELKIVYIQ